MGAHDRSFAAALRAIECILPGAAPRSALPPARPPGPSPSQQTNEDAMRYSMQALGITDDALNSLNVMHISGTKGKGSTAAMCESILRANGLRTGLFTSPHLLTVNERIRIDGLPMVEDRFAKYFWDVWEVLDTADTAGEGVPKTTFFRVMTLVALYAFLREGLDVVILEVGLGGRLDNTNVVPRPYVCGTTHIGYDHMLVLGNTLTQIASEKAGIAKPDVPYLIAPNQRDEAQASLVKHAAERGARVATVPTFSANPGAADITLGLHGFHQQDNAALAVGLCTTWFEQRESKPLTFVPSGLPAGGVALGPFPALPSAMVRGLEGARWAGRCQTVEIPGGDGQQPVMLFIDGAHTDESVTAATSWFATTPHTAGVRRELLFYCMPGRDPGTLLRAMQAVMCASAGAGVARAHFTPLKSSKRSLEQVGMDEEERKWVVEQRDAWDALNTGVPSQLHESLSAALDMLQSPHSGDAPAAVFVTGSLYLAGDILRLARERGADVTV